MTTSKLLLCFAIAAQCGCDQQKKAASMPTFGCMSQYAYAHSDLQAVEVARRHLGQAVADPIVDGGLARSVFTLVQNRDTGSAKRIEEIVRKHYITGNVTSCGFVYIWAYAELHKAKAVPLLVEATTLDGWAGAVAVAQLELLFCRLSKNDKPQQLAQEWRKYVESTVVRAPDQLLVAALRAKGINCDLEVASSVLAAYHKLGGLSRNTGYTPRRFKSLESILCHRLAIELARRHEARFMPLSFPVGIVDTSWQQPTDEAWTEWLATRRKTEKGKVGKLKRGQKGTEDK